MLSIVAKAISSVAVRSPAVEFGIGSVVVVGYSSVAICDMSTIVKDASLMELPVAVEDAPLLAPEVGSTMVLEDPSAVVDG
jgi:hypothetical protein